MTIRDVSDKLGDSSVAVNAPLTGAGIEGMSAALKRLERLGHSANDLQYKSNHSTRSVGSFDSLCQCVALSPRLTSIRQRVGHMSFGSTSTFSLSFLKWKGAPDHSCRLDAVRLPTGGRDFT